MATKWNHSLALVWKPDAFFASRKQPGNLLQQLAQVWLNLAQSHVIICHCLRLLSKGFMNTEWTGAALTSGLIRYLQSCRDAQTRLCLAKSLDEVHTKLVGFLVSEIRLSKFHGMFGADKKKKKVKKKINKHHWFKFCFFQMKTPAVLVVLLSNLYFFWSIPLVKWIYCIILLTILLVLTLLECCFFLDALCLVSPCSDLWAVNDVAGSFGVKRERFLSQTCFCICFCLFQQTTIILRKLLNITCCKCSSISSSTLCFTSHLQNDKMHIFSSVSCHW